MGQGINVGGDVELRFSLTVEARIYFRPLMPPMATSYGRATVNPGSRTVSGQGYVVGSGSAFPIAHQRQRTSNFVANEWHQSGRGLWKSDGRQARERDGPGIFGEAAADRRLPVISPTSMARSTQCL